jgi:hypothetical protein
MPAGDMRSALKKLGCGHDQEGAARFRRNTAQVLS